MSSKTKPQQKLLLNRDTLNSTGDNSLPGLFKSTSSLARSLKRSSEYSSNSEKDPKLDQDFKQDNSVKIPFSTNKASSFTSSALLILNSSSIHNIKNSINFSTQIHKTVSSLNPVTEIRNLTHFYDKIDSNQSTYELLSSLKSEKRKKHLNVIDEFDMWNNNFLISVNENSISQLNELKRNLTQTKNEINVLFSKPISEIELLVLKDIKKIEAKFKKVKKKRSKEIEDFMNRISFTNRLKLQEIKEKIFHLSKKLNLIGFQLEQEIEEIQNTKISENTSDFDNRNFKLREDFTEIQNEESEFIKESEINLLNFVKRWKNSRLNTFVTDIKSILLSEEFVDNKERLNLISQLKIDQENIYQSRVKKFTENVMNKNPESFTIKYIDQIIKQLEEVFNSAQTIYDTHTHKLVENSEHLFNLSQVEIEKFKEKVKTIDYEFGEDKDNYNNNLFNNYEELSCIEDLIKLEIDPIVEEQKQIRKDFITKIIAYLDEYDDYTHNICMKLINIFSQIAIKNDEHKRNLYNNERNYLIELAKAADHDDDIIYEKEEHLKKVIQEIIESIDKEVLERNLENAFKILDELGIEYKEFFKIVESLFVSHEGQIRNVYNSYEENILSIFGISTKDKMPFILAKRNIESEFLSKVKEAEIASEEAKAAMEFEKNNPKNKGAVKKKTQGSSSQGGGVKNKKGEMVMLVPARRINQYTSKLNNQYLIDFSIAELVQHNLRNVIYNREDNILNFVPVVEEEMVISPNPNSSPNSNINPDPKSQGKSTKDKEKGKPQIQPEKKEKSQIVTKDNTNRKSSKKLTTAKSNAGSANNTAVNFLEQFNPYAANTQKEFHSPLAIKNFKLLSEENIFKENFLIEVLENLFESLTTKIIVDLQKFSEKTKILDNEKRENYLIELDLKLKSLAPRKGKIEVEEYDKRLSEIEKHKDKFESHTKIILERNSNDNNENNTLIMEISNRNLNFNQLYEKIFKGMDEETTLKGLEEKQKKFKTSFYELGLILEEAQEKFLTFSIRNPENLIQLNNNFILSIHTFSKGGTYSQSEEEFYKQQTYKLNEEIIFKDKKEREIQFENKMKEIKTNMANLLEKLEKKYLTSYENIMARDGVGEKFGAPRRLANDIIIKIKIKCNQAQEGLNTLLENLKKTLTTNEEGTSYGKYIDAFKASFMSSYSVIRVNVKDNVEYIENLTKDEIEEDDKRRQLELLNLGYLTNLMVDGSDINLNKSGNISNNTNKNIISYSNFNYNNEINAIDEKVRAECLKVYTGEFAKLLNNTNKIPNSMVTFLQNLKNEMENFRLKCVRDLRTLCQKYFEMSYQIPKSIFSFVYEKFLDSSKNYYNTIIKSFTRSQEASEALKKELNIKLGPYLANPHYKKIFEEIDLKENERRRNNLTEINQSQFFLLDNEEKNANQFLSCLINNFEALLSLFDNFIFEEDFIQLGDEEYFKQRKDYNFLLKLKNENRSNLNLDSKRTFKKIFSGLDRNKLKINFSEKFKKFALDLIQNDEEKLKIIETNSKRENFTKNITGLKLQNNKNLFLQRNEAYENYCKEFNSTIDKIIDKFNKLRIEEINYQTRWDEMTKELKSK